MKPSKFCRAAACSILALAGLLTGCAEKQAYKVTLFHAYTREPVSEVPLEYNESNKRVPVGLTSSAETDVKGIATLYLRDPARDYVLRWDYEGNRYVLMLPSADIKNAKEGKHVSGGTGPQDGSGATLGYAVVKVDEAN